MPDQRIHRGPHPEDRFLFPRDASAHLVAATHDLCWLLSRDYAPNSALKLVGDRYRLEARQRTAVARCAAGQTALDRRRQHEVPSTALAGELLLIDGYNVLTSIEAALAGGVILKARDGCYRDMASMHGSYRKVQETVPALERLGEMLDTWEPARIRWLLDAPVSNSGRLKQIMREVAVRRRWQWEIELVRDPDRELASTEWIAVSADSQILDRAARWFNLVRPTIDALVPDAWLVDLSVE